MASDKKVSNTKFFRKPVVIGLAVFAVIVLIPVIWLLVFVSTPDGTEKYNGSQKQAAQWAVKFTRSQHPIDPLPSFFQQVKVIDMRPTSKDELSMRGCDDPNNISNDSNDPRHYTVLVARERLGTQQQVDTIPVCYMLWWDKGYWPSGEPRP